MTGVVVPAQACLEAWINCENLLAELSLRQISYAHSLEKTVDDCAHICMETWQSLKKQPGKSQQIMMLCIGICEECAETCSRYDDDWFRQCARSCRICANKMTDLSLKHSLNQ